MEVNELINLIVNNGFPVAVSAYLLIRLEKQINALSSSINKLNTIISTKLGVVIDTDTSESSNNSHKVAWKQAINIVILMFIAFLIFVLISINFIIYIYFFYI